ncbi:MAG: hypothetical protein RE472_08430 [Thermoplasmatales archaeon]|nr:MAG: hypothetical protein RE472_08430 [Thermoplasmatales archaeon]
MKGFKKNLSTLPNSSFASVMGTGILSDALFHLGMMALSYLLMFLSISIYIGLIGSFLLKLFLLKGNIFKYSSKTVMQAFTFIAGTSVLFTRLYESHISIYPLVIVIVLLGVTILFISLYLLTLNFHNEEKENYLLFLPLISFLSFSILIGVTQNQIPFIFVSLEFLLVIISQIGTILVITYSLIYNHKRPVHIQDINGYYMIYSGILSLLGYSILGTPVYDNIQMTIGYIFHYMATVDIIASIFIALFMFIVFIVKIKNGLFNKKYKISSWGALFPLGVDSIGYYSMSEIYHVQFFDDLSYFFTFLAILVLIGIIMEFILYVLQSEKQNFTEHSEIMSE